MSQFFLEAAQVRARSSSPSETLARLLSARGEVEADPQDSPLKGLQNPKDMLGLSAAANLLASAKGHLCVVADYDCDGATACAVVIRGLRLLKPELSLSFIVPDRKTDGYGLSLGLVRKLLAQQPDCRWLLTVDNGIASVDGIALAKQHGLNVIVTDHHLPGATLPAADAIVNPNQLGCGFPSKALAGVGVAFYLMVALRARLRELDPDFPSVNLQHLCELVALGTVADLVPLDRNNRLLVKAGLTQIEAGAHSAGLQAILDLAMGSRHASALSKPLTAKDLGFLIAPRINAAGRLADMRSGINCLLEDNPEKAFELAKELDAINQQRKAMQIRSSEQATKDLDAQIEATQQSPVLVYFDPSCHEGIVGLIAGRLKERFYRPAFAFARAQAEGVLKGSGRSVEGLHLRDLLDEVSKQAPDVLLTFGGHAMAAGLSLTENKLEQFRVLANTIMAEKLAHEAHSPLALQVSSDGSGAHWWMNWQDLQTLENQIWGQAFSEPLFDDEFLVLRQELLKEKHTKLWLSPKAKPHVKLSAIRFFGTDPLPQTARLLYRMQPDRFSAKASGTLQAAIEVVHCVK